MIVGTMSKCLKQNLTSAKDLTARATRDNKDFSKLHIKCISIN